MSKLVKTGTKEVSTLSPLQLYLKELAKYPLLTSEQEYELAVKHHEDGDITAAHKLITSNLRLVVKIANDFRKAQTNLLDLVQEGNTGLMQAVKKFNPYKGVKLSSYSAWWIRAYILKFLLDHESQVKIATTAAQRKLYYNLKTETEKLIEQYDHADTKLIAKNLDVPERDVIEMQKRLSSKDISMDAPVSADTGRVVSRGELMSDDLVESIDTILADKQIKALFSGYLNEFREGLKDRDLELFETRLSSDEPVTLQELGDKFGVSRERARQIEARIVKKLKEFVREKGTLNL
ncbi:RNA polymerase factor sigma-32 [bacterium]|nr:RNA polymerase factor sigma-32 [bacterium]